MTELKCPFCNKPLQPTLRQPNEYWCENYDCPGTNIGWVGSQKLWQELTKTKQALDVAVDALKRIKEPSAWGTLYQEQELAIEALEQIKQITETKDLQNEFKI